MSDSISNPAPEAGWALILYLRKKLKTPRRAHLAHELRSATLILGQVCLAALEFQNSAQTFIDGSLKAWGQRAGLLGRETTVEGQELRDIDH